MEDYCKYGLELAVEFRNKMDRDAKSRGELPAPAPSPDMTDAEIRMQLAYKHPDLWLRIQDLPLPRGVLDVIWHLMGRTHIISVDITNSPDFAEVEE